MTVSWIALLLLVAVLALALLALLQRRAELSAMARGLDDVADAKARGSHKARLQYPDVDLTRCIGCGICVRACPEEGVLDLIHGQAVVVHGARCVGHGRCAEECPVGAIALTLGDLEGRRDLPALSESFEATHTPGLFLAGELTGYALIRTAIAHGTAVANEVAQRVASGVRGPVPGFATAPPLPRTSVAVAGGGNQTTVATLTTETREEPLHVHDLCVVGAGPAGLACSLQARARGLDFITLEREQLGGTVSQYPRRKLVMTQPVDLPLHGRLERTTFEKEELVDLWTGLVREHELPIRTGAEFRSLTRDQHGLFHVETTLGSYAARNVCLALGRRGTPRKLGVPGEDLSKVAYSLIDAQSYRGRRILVVGGGDSAIEAAIGLAEQPGNRVVLSYRKAAFFRIKARNEARLAGALAQGLLEVVYESQVEEVQAQHVVLSVTTAGGGGERRVLDNDEVFVFAGGTPPFRLLEESGVSFDPADRTAAEPLVEQGSGLVPALVAALGLACVGLGWVVSFSSYYAGDHAARVASRLHAWLRPSGPVGLGLGIAATLLILVNLSYLVRRSPRVRFELGSLRGWMTCHVVTGVTALLLVLLHSAMSPRNTVGGHALAALAMLIVTGAIGRYLYAYVPRAANGRELELDEVRSRLAALSGEWDRSGGFGQLVRDEVQRLIHVERWHGSLPRRLARLAFGQQRLRRALRRLHSEGLREGIPDDELTQILTLARRAQRTALMVAHYEDLRGLLASWRYLHRWIALLMVLLAAVHIGVALRFAGFGG